MPEKIRLGVVLDGGGAKGAYQVGCWKAIRQAAEFEIRAVAGSSVGALNAVLMAADRFDDCLGIWTGLRPWHVVGIRPKNLFFIPIWLIALLLRIGSKPSIRKFGPDPGTFTNLYMAFMGFVYLTSTNRSHVAWIFIAPVVALLVAGELAWFLRKIILSRGATTNAPLARTICKILEDPDFKPAIPSYATVSRWEPHASQECWYGWAPEYVRFDLMDRRSILEVLLASASLPGVFASSTALGLLAIDGGWCDNSPLAPLLFGLETELDLIFVLHLGPDALAPRPPGSTVFTGLGGKNPFDYRDASGAPDANKIADAMWTAHQRVLQYRDRRQLFRSSESRQEAGESPISVRAPRILQLVPSENLGGFLTGTLAFSAEKARSLIALGERDMKEILKSVDRLPIKRDDPKQDGIQ